jgi:hypothetical protein
MRNASNRASEIGHPCTRYHVAGQLLGHLRPAPDAGLQGIFARGRYFERYVQEEVIPSRYPAWQPRATQQEYYEPSLDLSGHADFVVYMPWLAGGAEVVLDSKSMTGGARMDAWPRIPPRWRAKYRGQVECYMRLGGYSHGGLLIGDAAYWGDTHLVLATPDDALWEEIQDRCRTVHALVEELRSVPILTLLGGELRDRCPGLEAGSPECAGCWAMGTVGCSWKGAELAVLPDEVEELLEARELVREQAEMFAELTDRIKDAAKQACPEGGEALAGRWSLKVRSIKSRCWDPPKEFKKQHPEYETERTSLRVDIRGGGDSDE